MAVVQVAHQAVALAAAAHTTEREPRERQIKVSLEAVVAEHQVTSRLLAVAVLAGWGKHHRLVPQAEETGVLA